MDGLATMIVEAIEIQIHLYPHGTISVKAFVTTAKTK
jgi:hypothetical protein